MAQPITLGEFRQFLSDSANSMADTQAARILDRVVGQTMRRLSREGLWNYKRTRALVLFEPRKTADFATLTNGSNLVPLDLSEPGAFPMESRFFEEHWNIQLDGRETVYQFAENPDPARIKLTTTYDGIDSPVGTFSRLNLTRSRFAMPETFLKIYGIELPQEGINALTYLNRESFEIYRRGLLTSASQPWVYTIIGNEEIEIWPPASEDRGFMSEIDYQPEVRVPAIGADDTEELDWPRRMEDLLWAIGRLQLLVELGADAVQFDAQSTFGNYQSLLKAYKADDQSRGRMVWHMGEFDRISGTPRPFGLNLRGPVRGM